MTDVQVLDVADPEFENEESKILLEKVDKLELEDDLDKGLLEDGPSGGDNNKIFYRDSALDDSGDREELMKAEELKSMQESQKFNSLIMQAREIISETPN